MRQIECGTIEVMLSPICEIETQLGRSLRLVHAKAEAGARHEGGRRRIASSRGRIVTMGVVRADVPVDIIGRREPQSSSERRHRSEEHTSELQSLMRISYAVFCLKKKKRRNTKKTPDFYKVN